MNAAVFNQSWQLTINLRGLNLKIWLPKHFFCLKVSGIGSLNGDHVFLGDPSGV